MTKEIIIDGVDVSECRNYDSSEYWKCEPFICHCEELPNCYFKQFKRAEKKLEKIKEYCNKYQMEYIVNNGVQLLTTRILQIIEVGENG